MPFLMQLHQQGTLHRVLILIRKGLCQLFCNLCYCLSQACNTRQTEHALYLRCCNINQEGMETQHVMDLSCARRTVNTIAKLLSENHCKSFKHFIQDAIENKWLLVLIIDDLTSIHTKRRPQGDKASEAKSVCTIVVKGWFPYDRRRSQTIADRKSQIADDRKERSQRLVSI